MDWRRVHVCASLSQEYNSLIVFFLFYILILYLGIISSLTARTSNFTWRVTESTTCVARTSPLMLIMMLFWRVKTDL